jgi:Proto-chlorophyllide reductase 57 kD subunit
MSEAPPPGRCPYPGHGAAPASGCPVSRGAGSPPPWEEEARGHAERTARAAASASHLDADRAVRMAQAAAEARADRKRVAEITELFVRTLGRKLGHGHPLSDRTGVAEFAWTPEAEERLREVPEFCRELTRWRVEWTAHKLGLGTTITPEVMQVKFDMWGRVSHAIRDRHDGGLPWTDEAYARFERIPEFVKGQVLEAVEGNARSMGATVVDGAVVDEVIARWIATGDFHEGLYGFR